MATGRPDYYSAVDITLQALSQLIVRPKFGGAIIESGSKEIVASVANNLAAVSGKGMVYGGAVWLDYTSTQANSVVSLIVDMQEINDLSFLRMNEYGINRARTAVVTLNKYDAVNFVYSAGISYGVTFESGITLTYTEEHGTTPTVHYILVYTLI